MLEVQGMLEPKKMKRIYSYVHKSMAKSTKKKTQVICYLQSPLIVFRAVNLYIRRSMSSNPKKMLGKYSKQDVRPIITHK